MASEQKACETIETVASDADEEEKNCPLSPQSLGRKPLRAANRELAG